jgi:hypothetical protein
MSHSVGLPSLLTVCGLLVGLLTSCSVKPTPESLQPKIQESVEMTNNASIKLGESAKAFIERYPQAKVVRQPAGIDFYSLRWSTGSPGLVSLENGKNALAVEHVLSTTTSEDQAETKQEGFTEFNINAGITAPERIPHDEARLKTYAILRGILDAGWQQVIERSEPRLKGKARQDYMFATSNLNGLDATFVPTFEEWMRVESRTPWSFYANGVYLEVSFTREPTLTDPTKPGAYLLTYNIKTETEYFRGYAGPDDRLRWKEVVPKELVKVAALRAQKEAELKAKGVPIDESYKDPPVPSFN